MNKLNFCWFVWVRSFVLHTVCCLCWKASKAGTCFIYTLLSLKLKVIRTLPVNKLLFIIFSLWTSDSIIFQTQNCCSLHIPSLSIFPCLSLFVRNLVKLASVSECSLSFLFVFVKIPMFFFLRYGNLQHTGNWKLGSWWDLVQLSATHFVVEVWYFLEWATLDTFTVHLF